jgi:hypothetical protein
MSIIGVMSGSAETLAFSRLNLMATAYMRRQ